jgi:hypothetical protein
MNKPTMNHLRPDSTQTLREGIAELRRAEGAGTDAAETFAPELKRDIDAHDAIHVLFACPTSLVGEIIAHVWTVFGTTARMADMHRVNAHGDHRAVLAQIGHGRLLRTWLRSLPRILAAICSARRMKRRWPVEQWESFLDQRLCDLRRDFGIRLPKPSASPPAPGRAGGAALRTIRAGFPNHAATKS